MLLKSQTNVLFIYFLSCLKSCLILFCFINSPWPFSIVLFFFFFRIFHFPYIFVAERINICILQYNTKDIQLPIISSVNWNVSHSFKRYPSWSSLSQGSNLNQFLSRLFTSKSFQWLFHCIPNTVAVLLFLDLYPCFVEDNLKKFPQKGDIKSEQQGDSLKNQKKSYRIIQRSHFWAQIWRKL